LIYLILRTLQGGNLTLDMNYMQKYTFLLLLTSP